MIPRRAHLTGERFYLHQEEIIIPIIMVEEAKESYSFIKAVQDKYTATYDAKLFDNILLSPKRRGNSRLYLKRANVFYSLSIIWKLCLSCLTSPLLLSSSVDNIFQAIVLPHRCCKCPMTSRIKDHLLMEITILLFMYVNLLLMTKTLNTKEVIFTL